MEYDLRPEVTVPCIHKRNRHRRAVGGAHDGDKHPKEDADLAQTVETRRFNDVIGEGTRCLPEQHDHKRRRDGRQHKRRPAVDKPPVGHHLEQGDHNGHERQHHRQQQDAHQCILGLIMVNFKAIARDGADQQCDECHQDGVAEGVCHRQPQILVGDQRLEVFHQIALIGQQVFLVHFSIVTEKVVHRPHIRCYGVLCQIRFGKIVFESCYHIHLFLMNTITI